MTMTLSGFLTLLALTSVQYYYGFITRYGNQIIYEKVIYTQINCSANNFYCGSWIRKDKDIIYCVHICLVGFGTWSKICPLMFCMLVHQSNTFGKDDKHSLIREWLTRNLCLGINLNLSNLVKISISNLNWVFCVIDIHIKQAPGIPSESPTSSSVGWVVLWPSALDDKLPSWFIERFSYRRFFTQRRFHEINNKTRNPKMNQIV